MGLFEGGRTLANREYRTSFKVSFALTPQNLRSALTHWTAMSGDPLADVTPTVSRRGDPEAQSREHEIERDRETLARTRGLALPDKVQRDSGDGGLPLLLI